MKYFSWLFILIAILATLVVVLLKHESQTKKVAQLNKPILITDYLNSDLKLRITADGDVRAKEDHRAVRVTVGPGLRQVEVLKGFNYDIERSKSYDNTQADFEVFARSIQGLGFTLPVKNAQNQPTDERGYCPFGVRYIFEVYKDDSQIMRLWSNSCSPLVGTFGGNGAAVIQLFDQQIPGPDFNSIIQGVVLAPAQ